MRGDGENDSAVIMSSLLRTYIRYGCYFAEPIGYRLDVEGNQIPLYYGEIKVTGDSYHVIPRTRPSQ